MCFKKREKDIPVDAPIAEQARPYLEHKKRLTELDFSKVKDVEIAIYCLNVNPPMVQDLNVNVERELSILQIWIKRDYSNYLLCVKNKVDHTALLTLYLTEKLQKTLNSALEGVSLITSFDKKLVLNYMYETKRGETISYFDKALGVPTSLVAKANVKLKLIDAQKLVEKIDIDVKYIDMSIVTNFVTASLNRIVRDTILSFIATKNLSYYDLPQHYTLINGGILDNLREYFRTCGLDATEFALSDISVPNNTDAMLKNQFFAIAEAERIKTYEQRMESASLDLYERKAAIHSKYPDFPLTLTEAEKDLALNRYLTRMGRDTSLKADIEEKQLTDRTIANDGTVTTERKVSIPTYIKKSNKFRLVYGIMVALIYVVSLSMFAIDIGAGLVSLGIATLIAGMTAFFGYNRLKYGSKTKQIIDTDYSRGGDMYISQEVESGQDVGNEIPNDASTSSVDHLD